MPRGKELEQLPMSHIAPGSPGEDPSKMNRESLQGITEEEPTAPAKAGLERKKRG